jgi:hypothetical protein
VGEAEGRPVGVVGLDREAHPGAAVGLAVVDDPGPRADPPLDVPSRRRDQHRQVEGLVARPESPPDVVGRVAARDVARPEDGAGALRVAQPVEPERAPVLAVEVVAEQVPPAPHGHELVGLDVPAHLLAG